MSDIQLTSLGDSELIPATANAVQSILHSSINCAKFGVYNSFPSFLKILIIFNPRGMHAPRAICSACVNFFFF